MKKLSIGLRTSAVLAVVAVAVIVAMGAGSHKQLTVDRADVRGFIVPASQIISFDDTVGRLDTRTGAIYRLHGVASDPTAALDNPSAKLTWEERVPAVKGDTSGVLEIQRPTFNRPDATFLVDIVTGKTWILRRRASSNRSWEPIETFR